MYFDQKTKIRLHGLEKSLQQAIRQGEFPFLGHYADCLYEVLKESIAAGLKATGRPLRLYLDCLQRWPAVFATYLIQYVAEGFGTHGNHEVYPFIQKALKTELTLREKEKLWEAVRSACLRLGMSVSPRRSGSNYMVEEYLRQAGVPLRYVEELAQQMSSHAGDVGCPDDDDPASILLWQQGLRHRVRYMSKSVQKAIEADDEGFYTRLFLKIRDGLYLPDENSPEIEKRLALGLEKSQAKTHSGQSPVLAIPKILFRDGLLGVELPPGEDSTWRVECNGCKEEHAGLLEARFVPFSESLPGKVAVSDLHSGKQTSAELWEDDRNNRFLVFSENGDLKGRGRLGQEEALLLEPGEYDLLLRFEPSNLDDQLECLADEHELFVYRMSLDPAGSFEIQRGPARACFKADTKPALVWTGQKYRGVQGNELFASHGLCLDVKVPEELFVDADTRYVLKLQPGTLGPAVEVPVCFEDGGRFRIDMEDYCTQWSPGLTRLLVELKREGFQRAETRSAINVWNGLKGVRNRTQFICTKLPPETNLLFPECDNVKVDHDNGLITFRNEDQRLFRMVFQVTDRRKQPFTWSVPGVFMQLLDYQDQGTIERPLKKGSTLSVSVRSREVLEIFSSSNGVFQLGKYRKPADFDRVGRVRIPLAGLVDFLGPGADTLIFIDHNSQVHEDLLRLVAPHQILDFRTSQHVDKYVLRFSTRDEVEEVSLIIKDMITGWKKELSVRCNASKVQGDGSFSVWLSCSSSRQDMTHEHELEFFLENWPNGAWIISLSGKINGRWGRFSNVRNDHYAVGLPVVGNQIYKSAEVNWSYIKDLSTAEKENILKRIHRRLLDCYAPEAWREIEWLGFLWARLTDEFADEETPRLRIITLAEEVHDDSSDPSWVPLFSLVSKFPKLYSQLGKTYRNLPNRRQLMSLKCLMVLGEMKYGVLPLLQNGTLNNMAAFGFSNPREMQLGRPPKKFSLSGFEEALKMEDLSERLRLLRQHEWQPGEGDYLGALHYRFASEKLTQNYRASMTGNEYRRGKALSLCRNLRTISLQGAPSHLTSGPGFLNLSTAIYDEEAQISVEEDHIEHITRFLSHYARACRWEIRCPGTLETVQQKAIEHLGSKEDFDLVLGYLLVLGKDLFMFYLMMWEAAFKADVDHQEGVIYVRQ
ncbi:hypothetical protein C2E25_11345 [Geothermobacter hydrogeniphilus]|uniref:Uncharacterized protein n=1 Tax=Geothermobacter hydrogeniphilus TaxID=1969733 RepID=A0A2K2H8Z2_9BACT|nr:hypothetical protein [Geothermobacter hydrogeniphilus]PNU19690.1 hypothetical protein C2E25_11345 [Geothermobacter hydrogeniphilus]